MFGEGSGVVAEFDDKRGLGVVETAAGRRYPFHCSAIADGTRTIAAGTRVVFVIVAGRLGRQEATAIGPRP